MSRTWARWGLLVVVTGLLMASCAEKSLTTAAVRSPGDGQLDCAAGEIAQSAGIEVFAETETEVVALALDEWASQGAAVVALPEDESWSAVLDARDVAIAYPEQNGDGRWTVHAVSTCGPPQTGPAPLDGNLDCVNDSSWSEQGSTASATPGLPTPDQALRSALQPFLDRHGGKITMIREGVGSLVLDNRERVVAIASEVEAGGWIVFTLSGCQGFER